MKTHVNQGHTLLVGAAKVDITPTLPVPLAGYPALRLWESGPGMREGYIPRVGPSEGVHDPIHARAVAIDDGNALAVVVALDICIVPLELTQRVRKGAQERWGLDPAGLLLAASHSHSGPDYFGYFEPVDTQVPERLVEVVLRAIGEAVASRRPARLHRTATQLHGLSINRRHAAGPVDSQVDVVRFDCCASGAPIALLFCFACHPLIAGPGNRLVSGEFPGFAASLIENAWGPDMVAAFLNGAAGNINPRAFPYDCGVDVSEKSRKETLAGRPVTFRTLTEAARFGLVLGAKVVLSSAQLDQPRQVTVTYFNDEVRLPLKEADALEQFLCHVPHSPDVEEAYRRATFVVTEVTAMRLGDLVLVGMPGEPFVEIGLQLQKPVQDGADVRVLGYVNDYPGYVVPPNLPETNRYEDFATPLAPSGANRLIAAAERVRNRALAG